MNTEVFFEDIQCKIIEHLKLAQDEVDIAVAWFTDRQIISVLRGLLKNGVKINIIFYDDHINNKGILQRLYNDGAKIRCSKTLMHNKFCLIDDSIVINGSYNWTENAKNNNNENIQITYDNPELVKKFRSEFIRLFEINGKSKKYFMTDEELFKEYLLEHAPISYPCFKKVSNPKHSRYEDSSSLLIYIFIPDKQILFQYFTKIEKEREYTNNTKYIDVKEFKFYDNVYGELDKEFIYFVPGHNTITVSSKDEVFQIDKTGQVVTGKIKGLQKIKIISQNEEDDRPRGIHKFHSEYQNQNLVDLYFIYEDNKHCLYNLKDFKCIDIPNYFSPSKIIQYDHFLLLEESTVNGLNALLDLQGNVLINPYYSKIIIDEKSKTIECTEVPILKKSYDYVVKSYVISQIDYIANNLYRKVKYIITDVGDVQRDNTIGNNYQDGYLYLSENDGSWAELYKYLSTKYNIKHFMLYDSFCKAKDEFRGRLRKLHNSKDDFDVFWSIWKKHNDPIIPSVRQKAVNVTKSNEKDCSPVIWTFLFLGAGYIFIGFFTHELMNIVSPIVVIIVFIAIIVYFFSKD